MKSKDIFNDQHLITRALKRFKEWVIAPELEVILHPSRKRLQIAGIFCCIGHFLFWWLWTQVIPQPYENWWVRLFVGISGLGLVFLHADNGWHSRNMRLYFSLICWLQFPFFFVWMYLMNANSSMWMASVAAVIVMYYQLTDWRLATLGLLSGAICATLLATRLFSELISPPAEHIIVFGFSWFCSILFALSSANLRRERLKHSLTVIGIMAHELRTPLATLSLIAQAIRAESGSKDTHRTDRWLELASRTDSLARAINHHIDLQMSNARYEITPSGEDVISAEKLVLAAINDYPFGSRRERQCVQVVLHQDFWFRGSKRQFTQVLNNLIKNAMHSLKAAQSRYHASDLRIELGMRGKVGRIQITDNGIGINSRQLGLIFEPFFSTANETGHGLGLAYCKQVVEGAGGHITACSEPAMGATFTLQLPCQPPPSTDTFRNHEITPLSPA